MTTINQKWKEFETAVLDPGAPEIQRTEMKRAFFAGFAGSLDILSNELAELSDEEGADGVESLRQQCKGFGEAVKLGAA